MYSSATCECPCRASERYRRRWRASRPDDHCRSLRDVALGIEEELQRLGGLSPRRRHFGQILPGEEGCRLKPARIVWTHTVSNMCVLLQHNPGLRPGLCFLSHLPSTA